MEGEQFSLCWNNFHSNLSSGFHALYKEEDLVDVTLAAEGKYIKAHKTVLSICSPYFKELFRANPCKHPIVILQDVNYAALCSLLQFMYQGQVSVSQEEIPTFMRVAETLKVKGLTDNGSSKLDSNGVNNFSDQKNVMKKPLRPVKKLVRPIQQQQNRPVGSPIPRMVKSPLPASSTPPAKKMHLDEQPQQMPTPPSNILQQQPPALLRKPDYKEPLLEPKMEPMDHPDDDDSTQQSFDEEQFDMNAMLDQSLDTGDNSTESMPPGWTPDNVKQPDTSSPAYIAACSSQETSYDEETNDIHDHQMTFVSVLEKYPILFDRSMVPSIKEEKDKALKDVLLLYNQTTNQNLGQKQILKKFNNMKAKVRKLMELNKTGNNQVVKLNEWQRKLIEIWRRYNAKRPLKRSKLSSPGTLQCILGRRGNPRLIVDGHVFYKKSTYKGKAFWYCKNSRTPDKCQAVCWTMNGTREEALEHEDTGQKPGGGRLIFLRSGRGQLVLIHNGHMYTLGKAKDDRYMWICVKKKIYSCNGCVVTMEGPLLLTHTVHNHPQLDDVIRRLQVAQVPPVSSMTALNLSKKK